MTDLDPKIWENPTLGAAAAGPFLDEVEAQKAEDLNARREGREPLVARHIDRYPKFPEFNVPSTVSTVELVPASKVFPVAETSPVEEDEVIGDPMGDDIESILKGINDDSNPTE